MNLHMVLITVPVVLCLLARLVRRPQRALADLALTLRDLITLRMLLRDTDPDQRAALLDAHRAWRTEPARPPHRTPRHTSAPRG
ncbi:hypothetical protein [Streptomyces triticiradicis]|uniref:Uncharacterized protein n=1 Tax=Streptomyces triticiradicis TaxID=2651189 RepID=A0A7J5D3F2_9ACTN|nr:hypothetical protein [Streptomyces triticiradicis]KAB1978527.1 hypothetical protein F8144_39490 [Streptomyces triticiradicis]